MIVSKEFIANLKEGDTVIVTSRFRTKVCTVEKITPTGLIKVDKIYFNKNGVERGGDAWSKSFLQEATPEAVTKIKENAIIQKAIRLMRETPTVTVEQAMEIIIILSK